MKLLKCRRGLSLIELIVTMVILTVLASVILPSARMTSKRIKEIELRRTLRMMRTAIDDYHKAWQQSKTANPNAIPTGTIRPGGADTGYPESLQELVDGKDFGDGPNKVTRRFLRRIPVDPFNPPKAGEKPEWGLRGSQDDPESGPSKDPKDVFDVFSLSEETAIDGTKYKDW